MTRYTVVEDFYVQEFDLALWPGDEFADGDIEPDLVADLVSRGVAVPEGAESIVEDDDDLLYDLSDDDLSDEDA